MRVPLRDGLTLHAAVRGRGERTVLLLHGFAGSADAWSDAVLDRLASRATVYAVDLLGHGESDRPHLPDRYAVDDLLGDLVELLDAMAVRRATWIGYSMGGRLALAAAVRHPARVESLVLEGASPGLETEPEREERRAHDDAVAQMLEEQGIETFADHWVGLPIFASRRRLPSRERDDIRRRLEANDALALAACLRGFGRGAQPSFWPSLPPIDVPVSLIVGEEDTDSRQTAEHMAALTPGAHLMVVPECGHTVHLEAPDAWLKAVDSHLASSP